VGLYLGLVFLGNFVFSGLGVSLNLVDFVFVVGDLTFLLSEVVVDLLSPGVVGTAGFERCLVFVGVDRVGDGAQLIFRGLFVGLRGSLGLFLQNLVGFLGVFPG
jgi:hypothetical protein